jgi:rare lipoprotein A
MGAGRHRRDRTRGGGLAARGLALAVAAALVAAAAGPSLAYGGGRRGGPAAHVERGEASYYGAGFHGRRTASGARFDRRRLTAAHPRLPLGSRVVVTNLENGRRVEVEVNDRGPHAREGRVIDLSEAAARRIGITREEGVAPVAIVVATR